MFDWLFRNRQTGEITIGQRPNAAIVIFAVAWATRRILEPTGSVGTALDVIVTGSITVWALDELIRGVNPWRRILGAGRLISSAIFRRHRSPHPNYSGTARVPSRGPATLRDLFHSFVVRIPKPV